MRITHDIPNLPSDYQPKAGSPKTHSKFESFLLEKSAKREEVRKETENAAAGLVAEALIMPILKQVRRSEEETKGPFSPGKAEKAFGPVFDIQLADRLAHSPRMGATKAITDRLISQVQRMKNGKVLNVHG